jgi:hypothetical protein
VAKPDPSSPLAGKDIDLDRVIMDPAYRRRVVEQLRVEAALRAPPTSEPPRSVTHDD